MAAKAVKKKPDTDTKTQSKKSTKTGTKKTTAKTSAGISSSSAKKRSSSSSGNAAVVSKKQEVTHAAEPATKHRSPSPFAKEATLLILWALCAFLFFSHLGFGGYIGDFLANLSFGLFGTLAYLLPVLLAFAAGFLISNHGSYHSVLKTLAGTVLYFTVCSFIGLGDSVFYSEAKILDIYQYCANGKTGGGAVSGELCHLLTPALGSIGTGIFLTIAALLCLLLITQRSLLKWLYGYLKEFYAASSRRRAQWREEREADENAFSNFPDQAQLQVERKPVNTGHTRRQERENQGFSGRTNRSVTQRRKSDMAAAEDTDFTRRGVRIEQRDVTPSLIVETAERPSARIAAGVQTDSAVGVSDPVSAAHTSTEMPQDSTPSAQTVRTEIDIPIHFPATPRQRRQDHKVTGVTLDTRITGDPATVGSDVREILSPRASSYTEEEQTEEPRIKPNLRYIDLDADGEDSDLPDDFLSQLQGFPFQETPSDESNGGDNSAVRELSGESFDALNFDSSAERADDSIHRRQANTFSTNNTGVQLADSEPDAASAIRMEDGDSFLSARDTAEISSADEDISDEDIFIEENDAQESTDNLEIHAASRQESGSGSSFSPDDFFLSDEEAKLRASTSSGHVFTQSAGESSRDTTRSTHTDAASGAAESAAKEGQEHSAKRNPRSSEQEIQAGIEGVKQEAAKAAEVVHREHVFPPIDLLKPGQKRSGNSQDQEIKRTAAKLQQTLNSFGVHATVTNYSCGANVTRYEVLPQQGVKVSKIVALTDDIRLNLAAADIRIEAPIPGKSAIGIEVPNKESSTVALRDLLESDEFKSHKSNLAFAVGKDIGGNTVVADIAKMPHLLIAGATGSGKSVCINTLIMSILYKAKPEDVKLIMIDPKVVELSVYNGIPHLFIPVVTDPKKAAGALNWGVAEMTDRYNKFAEYGVRDLKGYNQKVEALGDIDDPNKPKKLPQIVIIVDELADLMMVAPGEVEDSICRLAQLARAAGIHLIIATQRPSVNVITGLIKANMPSRIAFSVSSGVDSRTIIDMNGAEKLLGKGDMLFYPQGYQKPARVQGAFVSDEEVSDVVDFLKEQNTDASYNADMQAQMEKVQQVSAASRSGEDVDELFADAGKFIIEKDKASIGMLQRVFKIGFNRAARIMDQLSDAGVVGPEEGTKPRKILMSESEFENYLDQN